MTKENKEKKRTGRMDTWETEVEVKKTNRMFVLGTDIEVEWCPITKMLLGSLEYDCRRCRG